jgi:hypothetical protein
VGGGGGGGGWGVGVGGGWGVGGGGSHPTSNMRPKGGLRVSTSIWGGALGTPKPLWEICGSLESLVGFPGCPESLVGFRVALEFVVGFVGELWNPCGSLWESVGSLWDPCGILVGSLWDPCGILVGFFGGKAFPGKAFLSQGKLSQALFPRPKKLSRCRGEHVFGLGKLPRKAKQELSQGKLFPPKIPQGSHKDPTRIPQGSHKNPTRIPQGSHKSQQIPTRTPGDPANPNKDPRGP